MTYTYLDCLALLGIGGAHPGGLALTKEMTAAENMTEQSSILDIGCGTGQSAAYLAETYGASITAIDSNAIMIEKAKQRFQTLGLPIQTHVGNAEKIPFEANTFDFILSESVIVFTSISKTLSEMKRVLKPNGRLLAVEMTLENPITKNEKEELMQFYTFQDFLTEKEWIGAFNRAGFQDITVEPHKQDLNQLEIGDAPDFALTEDIEDEVFFKLESHKMLTLKYHHHLGYRIFRCN